METLKHFGSSSLFSTEKVRKFFEHEERESLVLDQFFWNCFDYLRANEIRGDYTEFGSGFIVRSFRLAAKYKSLLYAAPKLYAFDSFCGLPAIKKNDEHPGWHKGAMAISIRDFRALLKLQGTKKNDYHIVSGFFEKTLRKSPKKYGMSKVAFAFIDCDLYQSTKSVLPFIFPLLSHGAILAFDDWNCFKGDPTKGQKRALREYMDGHSDVALEPFLNFGWHGQAFLVNRP